MRKKECRTLENGIVLFLLYYMFYMLCGSTPSLDGSWKTYGCFTMRYDIRKVFIMDDNH